MDDAIRLRPPQPGDLERCASICFDAFGAFNARHGFPSDFPTAEVANGLMHLVFNTPAVFGVVAESADGQVVGSNFLWDGGLIAGVGPITVDPAAQSRAVGRRLMEAVLAEARDRNFAGVRLCQAAFNGASMSLYTKLGFDVREPLVCLQGDPPRTAVPGYTTRPAADADLPACADLCRQVHGHDRTAELRFGIASGDARVAERGSSLAGYAAGIGFFAHAVALDTPALLALIAAAPHISGPGLLLPSRNGEAFRWCLAHGLRVVQPLTLMSLGLYNDPSGAFLPSILY